MSKAEYAQMPEEIEINLVDIVIDQPGFRSKKFTIATTMLQREVFTRDWLMSVYRSRWLVELDVRAIKCSLGMDIVRAKTPAMVQTEIWSCLQATRGTGAEPMKPRETRCPAQRRILGDRLQFNRFQEQAAKKLILQARQRAVSNGCYLLFLYLPETTLFHVGLQFPERQGAQSDRNFQIWSDEMQIRQSAACQFVRASEEP